MLNGGKKGEKKKLNGIDVLLGKCQSLGIKVS